MVRGVLFFVLTLALNLGLASAAAADPSACLNCHVAGEFSDMDATVVREALADAGIPAHGRFAELTEDEVKVLLEALSE